MKAITKLTIFCVVAATLPLILTTPKAAESPDKSPERFTLDAFPSSMVETGRTVILSVRSPKPPSNEKLSLYYQWRKNDLEIPGATNVIYRIASVQSSDAASYTVVLSGAVEMQSAPMHLSVYSRFENQSNGGHLTVPIGDFTSGTYTVCSSSGFTRYKVLMPFNGPNTSPASIDFPNTSNETNLIVNTCTNANGATLDTAIKIMENFGDMLTKCCNNNFNCSLSNTKLSSCTATGLLASSTYRVGIYYKHTTLGSLTNVTFKWKYSNAFVW